MSISTAQSIIRTARDRPDLEWARLLASAIQVSIVGYCAAGTFLNLGFYDLFYALVALLTAAKVVVAQAVAAERRVGREGGAASSYGSAPAVLAFSPKSHTASRAGDVSRAH